MTSPTDFRYRKYAEALRWFCKPNFLKAGLYWEETIPVGARHDFAVFYAESDWDDPSAAWNDFRGIQAWYSSKG